MHFLSVDVNHELGKVKENILSESSSYIRNLRSDAATVGSLIRSESVKFSNLFAKDKEDECKAVEGQQLEQLQQQQRGIPKSTSLPVIAGANTNPSNKYRYKSSFRAKGDEAGCIAEDIQEEELFKPQEIDQSIVDKFIKVVEVKDRNQGGAVTVPAKRWSRNTAREDIRRKLAFSGTADSDRGNGYSRGFQDSNDLQICFINEAVDEEEEEDDDEESSRCTKHQIKEDSSEDEYTGGNSIDAERTSLSEEKRLVRKKLLKLQKEVQGNLKDCKQIASRLIEKERQKRREKHPLRAILGVPDEHPLDFGNRESLGSFNVAKLQVIANHCHSEVRLWRQNSCWYHDWHFFAHFQIESLNDELVKELLKKDELLIEQEGQLLDIEDLSCSFRLS